MTVEVLVANVMRLPLSVSMTTVSPLLLTTRPDTFRPLEVVVFMAVPVLVVVDEVGFELVGLVEFLVEGVVVP